MHTMKTVQKTGVLKIKITMKDKVRILANRKQQYQENVEVERAASHLRAKVNYKKKTEAKKEPALVNYKKKQRQG